MEYNGDYTIFLKNKKGLKERESTFRSGLKNRILDDGVMV
jgi:hypothetical protein